MSFLLSQAVASSHKSQVNQYSLIIMLVVFGLLFYLLIVRPQHKRTKEHNKLIASLSKGDEVLTTSGLIGCVTKISDTGYIMVALNNTNEVTIKRDFVAAILPKGTMKSIKL